MSFRYDDTDTRTTGQPVCIVRAENGTQLARLESYSIQDHRGVLRHVFWGVVERSGTAASWEVLRPTNSATLSYHGAMSRTVHGGNALTLVFSSEEIGL